MHNFTSNISVPPHVMAFLEKGGKFIPDRRAPALHDLHASLFRFSRSLRLAHFFSKQPDQSDRQRSSFAVPSLWSPPDDPEISQRLVDNDLSGY